MDQQANEQQSMHKLNEIAHALSLYPLEPDSLLRQYISIYVQSHHRSDEYFTTLCEHRFMMLLLENSNKTAQPTCVLQCLNLLFANTKQSSQLAYFLSQNAVHEYLFGPYILQKDTDFIQYYVQLLKTLLMKISQHQQNKSLIRMFCNNKYPTFPLLTYTTILAGDTNQLIKVTAQQCILILVGMINEKKLYSIYLSEPPMLAFIVRLATQFLKAGTDHEGICKYLADLMYELRGNKSSLMLISNILCNVIIVSSLPHKTAIALSFVQIFSKSIQIRVLEHKGLVNQHKNDTYYKKKQSNKHKYYDFMDQSDCQNLIIICSSYYRIIIKYMTNKYVNGVYLAAYINLSPPTTQNQSCLPLKIIYPSATSQYQILKDYSLKKYIDEEHPSSQVELGFDFMDQIQNAMKEYCLGKDFVKTKESYYKKNSVNYNGSKSIGNVGFFGRIFNRGSSDQLSTQYIKHVSDFSGVSFVKNQPIGPNLGKQIIASNCPFFYQYINFNKHLSKGLKYDNIKTGQQSQTCQTDEIHFNDIRALWSFNVVNLQIIGTMSKRFIEFINSQSNQIKTLIVPKMYIPPCYLFLGQLKDYLGTSIQDHINRDSKNNQLMQSIPMLVSLSKVCTLLNVQLSQTAYLSLASQLTNTHQQLQTCLFQNGFKDVVEYIKTKNKLTTLQIEDKINKSPKVVQSSNSQKIPEKKSNPIKIKIKPNNTFLKLCSFESIQKIMDPHMKPLNKYFELKWRQTFSKMPNFFEDLYEQVLITFKVSYFGKAGCSMSFIKLMVPPTIVLRVELNHKKILQVDLIQLQGIKRNTIDNRVLQFGNDNVQNIKAESSQMADEIMLKFSQFKFKFQQCVTNATLQYLSNTNQCLALKGRKLKGIQRFSSKYQTPQ